MAIERPLKHFSSMPTTGLTDRQTEWARVNDKTVISRMRVRSRARAHQTASEFQVKLVMPIICDYVIVHISASAVSRLAHALTPIDPHSISHMRNIYKSWHFLNDVSQLCYFFVIFFASFFFSSSLRDAV